jgi:ribosome-binding factor A
MSQRTEKIQEALREAAAEFLIREANRNSLITVTRAEVDEGGRHGNIFITVFPDSFEEEALDFANRKRGEFSQFFIKHVRGAHMPHVEFFIDRGEKNRQRLDELSN